MTGKELGKFLYDNGVYDTYQFIQNTRKTITTACFCKDTILSLIKRMENEHKSWQENLFVVLNQQENPVKTISITPNGMPSYELSVCDVPITAPFLLDKLTKDFFQYVRNAFDCMAQAANTACLATKAKKINTVDFGQMKKVFTQQTYSQMFSSISAWFTTIANSDKFHYIEAFNNRTKHTCDVYLKVSMDFLGENHSSDINPFFRKDVQHDKKNISDYLNQIFDFAQQSFDSFMVELSKEYPKKTYLNDRYNKLKGWQQKLNSAASDDYAVVYIETANDISTMPEEISVLLLNRCEDGTIYSKNCTIDTILVKKEGSEYEYIGRYVANEVCGDDTLLRYRKYRKDTVVGMPALFLTQQEWKSNPKFYKANPFISFTTVTDDETFSTRVQLPF